MLLYFVEQAIWGMSLMNRYGPNHYSQVNRQLTGVYYIASQHSEVSPWYNLEGKLKRLKKAFADQVAIPGYAIVNTGTAAVVDIPDQVIDYVFTDPPFGENIYYADLNFFVESWHRVWTEAEPEAIIDPAKKKDLLDYTRMMQRCFAEYHRVLKPGRWITVVFHNSKNSVWNAIQGALQQAGFVVADVGVLDKKQGSYRQVTSETTKKDLIISAYKPGVAFEERFTLEAGTEEGAWHFIRTHLERAPMPRLQNGVMTLIAERTPDRLYDRMVAFYVQRGVMTPLSLPGLYAGLEARFAKRDGMYFLPEQVAEYDKQRLKADAVQQMTLLVRDEATARQWLRQVLEKKPQTFAEIQPRFMQETMGWSKHEKSLELSILLEESFLRYDGQGPVPSQIHSYLSTNFKDLRNLEKDNWQLQNKARDRWYVPDPNKAQDLEKLRERSLLKEFNAYRESKAKRLKVFRLEAVRAGFKKAWQDKDYATIIAVARKVPNAVLQEDPKLLMWYDQALTRAGDDDSAGSFLG